MSTPTDEILARDLIGRLESLARFSDGSPGVTRFTYSKPWCDAHRWLAREAQGMGLAATADWAGNLYFHAPGLAPGQRALLIGSHLDSVMHGGHYDGAYGTIAGLLVAAACRGGAGLPVVGFVTCEEEDSRFHGGMMGGRSLLGRVEEGELDSVADREGVTWRQALAAVREQGCAALLGASGTTAPPLFRPALELELHIEQGPVLEAQHLSLGIVERIAGYRRWIARIEGEARHSGTTPMALRRDALAAAAEMILAAESAAREAGSPRSGPPAICAPSPGSSPSCRETASCGSRRAMTGPTSSSGWRPTWRSAAGGSPSAVRCAWACRRARRRIRPRSRRRSPKWPSSSRRSWRSPIAACRAATRTNRSSSL